jgi:alanine racemase
VLDTAAMKPAEPSASAKSAGAILTVDLAAVVANWRLLKARVRGDCGAVVKADAYGVGLAPVARALKAAGCANFYVAHFDEGFAAREALGPTPRIVVMHGLNPGTEPEAARARLVPVLNAPAQIKRWADFCRADDFLGECIVHVDTGMNRLGLTAIEFAALMDDAGGFVGLHPLALMSHLACADEPKHLMNEMQRARFGPALSAFRTKFPDAKATFCNSAGIFLGPGYHYDLVRPGIALYGSNPTPEVANPMVPVVRLQAKILQVRRVDQAAPVGYGATALAPDGAKLATTSIGYADGLIRAWGAGGYGHIDGIRVPVIGRVSMDLIVFDVSNVPDSSLHPDATIEIIGSHQSVDEHARACGTLGYEVLTKLGRRYHRQYLPAA